MQKLLILIISLTFGTNTIKAQEQKNTMDNSNKLAVVWTSGDIEVAEKMVFMYVTNAKKQAWFDEVVFIVWGPSAKLLSENEILQKRISEMQELGIKVEACVHCANMYGVADDLKDLDIDVKGMGVPLSNYLKDGWKTLSF